MKENQPELIEYTSMLLAHLDGRTKLARLLAERETELMNDLGGRENLSYQQKALCQRVIHLESLCIGCEMELAKGGRVNRAEYLQIVSALRSTLQALGLERKSKDILTLDQVLEAL